MNAMQTVERPATLVRHPVTPTRRPLPSRAPCRHHPACPPADAVDRNAARIVAAHPEQGWNLLCNGVIAFDDGGALLPDRRAVEPRREPARH